MSILTKLSIAGLVGIIAAGSFGAIQTTALPTGPWPAGAPLQADPDCDDSKGDSKLHELSGQPCDKKKKGTER